ncbi:MAG: methane monooxygenase/ammonia monooxygenase subunit A, partial [Methylococcales bacterium]
TLCCISLVLGEWINRYFNFWGWTYFPINIVFPAILTPGAILLDGVLCLTNSFLATAVFGASAFALIFYPCNWVIIAGLHMPVEYHGILMSIADISGYHYVRTGTPEYIRMIEKGTLRTFGKDVAPVSAFFSAFVCMLIYFIWHFFGRWYGTTKFLGRT